MPASSLLHVAHLSLTAARAGLQDAARMAVSHGWAVSVAVVDAAGEPVAFEKHDHAAPVTPAVAQAKARTAALLRAPSKLFEDFINAGQPSFLATPGITPLQGGVPVMVQGVVVGAVGVSGSSGEGDTHLAAHAAHAIALFLGDGAPA